jgi:outer membrane usher protein FimD/PapC
MKTRCPLIAAASVAATFGTIGCATSGTANTKRNRDDVALMKEEAQRYEKKDGSLSGDYLVDLTLNGTGTKSNKPLFDQPRGDDKTQ